MKTYTSPLIKSCERKIYVDCPVCGKAPFYPFWGLKDCLYVRCQSCGLVYQNPQPVFADLKKRYQAEYFAYELQNEENFFKLMCLGLKDIGFTDDYFAHASKKTFLDIGCATGKLLAAMAEKGYSVQGVEICADSALYGVTERRVPIFIGQLKEANFPDDFFYFVHFSHLIEHVPDPYQFLVEVNRILDPQGFAIITTPNIESLQANLFKTAWRSAIPDHLFLFSKRTLRALLKKAGFEVLRIITWGGLAQGAGPHWLKKPLDSMAKRLGFGDVMLMLARPLKGRADR